MKPLKILLIFLLLLILIYLLNLFINSINYPVYWFTKLTAVSTALAALGGFLLLLATFWYVFETRKLVIEAQRQREPALTIRFAQDKQTPHFINIIFKNTGGGPAYDISVNFNPELPYRKQKSLNDLPVFKKLSMLESGESYEFFFDSAANYLASDNPKQTTATINYFLHPVDNRGKSKPIIREIPIDLEERKGQLNVHRRDLSDLVDEVEELKQNILILLADRTKDE